MSRRERKSRCSALGASFASVVAVSLSGSAVARVVAPGQWAEVRGDHAEPESWFVGYKGELSLLEGARVKSVQSHGAFVRAQDSAVEAIGLPALAVRNGGTIDVWRSTFMSRDAAGVVVSEVDGLDGKGERARARFVDSIVSGRTGIDVSAGASVEAHRSMIEGQHGAGIILRRGKVKLDGESTVVGASAGILVSTELFPSGPDEREVRVKTSRVLAKEGPGIDVVGSGTSVHSVAVLLEKGATVASETGVALRAQKGAHLAVMVADSAILGNVMVAKDAHANLRLTDSSTLRGSVWGPADVFVGTGALWATGGASSIHRLNLSGGTIDLTGHEAGPNVLRLERDLDGTGGTISLHAHLDTSGTWADQIAIGGSVVTSGPTLIDVVSTGPGAPTDINGDGRVDPREGPVVVTVAGSSRTDAFRLKGGYVVVGPYQYALHALGPSESGSSEAPAEGGWEYRLASRLLGDGPDPNEPGGPGSGSGGGSGGSGVRPALAPQMASYLSATVAMSSLAEALDDGMHQRMGELRDAGFTGPLGGEMFVRQVGRAERYRSNRGFSAYGFGFDQDMTSTQFGGSVVALDGDNGSLRAGWAMDHGRTTIRPRAADGYSETRLRENGASAWITWKHGSGLWLDGLVSERKIRGGAATNPVGPSVGSLGGRWHGMSVEAGLPLQLSESWSVEPHVRLSYRSGHWAPVSQDDGMRIRLNGGGYGRQEVGATVSRFTGKTSHYLRLAFDSTAGSGANLIAQLGDGSLAQRFTSGTPGNGYSVAAGFAADLTSHLQLFGESSYRHFLGNHGFQGWSGNLGMRMNF